MALTQFNLKAYQEVIDVFNRLFEESGEQTRGKFFEILLENYQNPRVKDKDIVVRYEAEYDQYQNKINELTEHILKIDQEKIDAEACAIDMTNKCQKLLDQKNDLSVQVDKTTLKENQIIITMEPEVRYFIDDLLERHKAVNKPTTAAHIFRDLFWKYIKNGAGDYLIVVYGDSFVSRVCEQFRRVRQLKAEAEHGTE
jgi:hypothetical protein